MLNSSYTSFDTYSNGFIDYDKTTTFLMKEFADVLVGRMIARGTYRYVFFCLLSDDFVVKVEKGGSHHNAMEWQMWDQFKNVDHVSKWLAPCVNISACGRVLIQRRTTPLIELPDKMPVWLSDFKVQNYGMFDGRVVCHDYGLGPDHVSGSMKAAEWWNGETGVPMKTKRNGEKNAK